ncbi:hypothetical protein SELR_pSRC400030 (plasmid) [Selenomonas ruminantium subsp. lactilytica TAM6421]|uniref:Uncharacterized protein n=1 Tax=Selenomonas ruminantium subsp. lactilytica (strain NBRC 103574 / TAM6421) TaxID=927704 RepID=I0GV67_SELRL|nr:hypothetical protein [Selenomonas ruminantium]BAL84654.1 hypothetical protein SELR_pSRC400030 [Selenomonas ruminantium subsp. lactilytica TAM6421]
MWNDINDKETLLKKIDERKQTIEKYLVGLYTLREFFPSVDGKIYNVRIRRAINELPDIDCYESSWCLFRVYREDIHGYEERDFISFTDEHLLDETGKRVDSEKAIKWINSEVQSYRKCLAELERDRLDGWERFEELQKIKTYYESQWRKFSSVAREGFRSSCKLNWLC